MTEQWDVGRALQTARENEYLSKRQAAARAGISESRWRQLESGYLTGGREGNMTAPPSVLTKAALAVNIPPENLLRLAGCSEEDVEYHSTRTVLEGLIDRLDHTEAKTTIGFIQGLLAARP